MNASKFTGERPGWGVGFEYDYARHVAAYIHAAGLAQGRSLLDAGCGEGFGTHTLCSAAAEVVGVDYSEDAVKESRRLWCDSDHPNLRFECVDLTKQGQFQESFDVVLSFQVLEHIQDPGPFLKGLSQRVKPGGLLMLTTPNRLRAFSENPFHIREYTAPELEAEMAPYFGEVRIAGVHGNDTVEEYLKGQERAVKRILGLDPFGIRNILPKSLVKFAFPRLARVVRNQGRDDTTADIVPEDFRVGEDNVDRALDLVALCRP